MRPLPDRCHSLCHKGWALAVAFRPLLEISQRRDRFATPDERANGQTNSWASCPILRAQHACSSQRRKTSKHRRVKMRPRPCRIGRSRTTPRDIRPRYAAVSGRARGSAEPSLDHIGSKMPFRNFLGNAGKLHRIFLRAFEEIPLKARSRPAALTSTSHSDSGFALDAARKTAPLHRPGACRCEEPRPNNLMQRGSLRKTTAQMQKAGRVCAPLLFAHFRRSSRGGNSLRR